MTKKLLQFAIITLITSLLSCSNSSTEEAAPATPPENNSVPTIYLPLKTLNFWNYTIEDRASNNDPVSTNTPAASTTEKLTTGSDVLYTGITHKKMETPQATVNGFYCSVLKNNGLRIDGTRLRISGVLNNNLIPGIPLNINLSDFIILKDNAVAGTALSATSGTVNQVISGYNLTINYTLSSVADGTLTTFTPPGTTTAYNNVKKTKLILNASITIPFSGVTATILEPQNVIVSTLHFAPQIGMVYDNRVFNFELNPAMPPALTTQLITAGFPKKSNQLQEEFIGLYDVSH